MVVADNLAPAPADSTVSAVDSLLRDEADTLLRDEPEPLYGIILERPAAPQPERMPDKGNGESWLLTGMILLFVIACLRYRKNSRFFSMMLHDITEVRERHNAFDDTVRETAFIWLLNLIWCGCAGVILYTFLYGSQQGLLSFGPEAMQRMGICMGLCVAYTLFLTASYSIVGNLFSDSGKASMWVKGFLATQGLESILFFPAALLLLCVPGLTFPILVFAGIVFILAKLLFIYKGFCIFFSQIASWVLFLYYLCSLEIVPIVLTYVAARYFCGLV